MKGAWVDELAERIVGAPIGDWPAAIRDKASLIFADTIGAILAGSDDEAYRRLAKRYAIGSGASVLGLECSATPERAAFLNGIAGTIAELDEGNYLAGGHPAIHAVPAALATAEHSGASGRALLDAVILGYEVGARIGAAGRLLPEVHSHGTWGTIGAAVAVARLRGFNAAQLASAIRIAAPLSIAASGSAGIEGASVRAACAGMAASNGMLACDMAEAGFTGEAGAVDVIYDRILGRGFVGSRVILGFGETWCFDHTFFKPFASCRETHGAIEIWRKLAASRSIDPTSIQEIRIATFPPASALCNRDPQTELAARFSIPFVLATFILRGRAARIDFAGQALGDPAIRALAARIMVGEATSPKNDPALRLTDIAVDIGGETLRASVSGALGDPGLPMSPEALAAKFAMETSDVGSSAGDFAAWAALCSSTSRAKLP